MYFNIIGVYKPPSANDTFYDQFTEIKHYGICDNICDFNMNWKDKLNIYFSKYYREIPPRTMTKKLSKDCKTL